jgi:membrane protein DedA with SNARE-associated domain
MSASHVLAYVTLFVAVLVSGAGVPVIGTVALTTAAVLASHDELSIQAVIAVACVARVLGGPLGYTSGQRWGVPLMERPGRREDRRRKALAGGQALFDRWGWLACAVTPAYLAGIAGMTFLLFLVVNSIAAVAAEFATALPAYGASSVASGHRDAVSIVEALVGVALLALLGRVYARRRRRAGGHRAGPEGSRAAVAITADREH